MEQAEHAHSEQKKRPYAIDLNNRLVFALIVIAILAVTIYARLGLANAQGLFEPDGFFYYSVVRATLINHLSEPQHLGISGFPAHNFIGEAPGLPYLTVIFYLLIGWTGASALEIMRYLPVFVGMIEVLLAYFLAKELSDSRLCGVLAMLFVGVSAGNIARTAALVYRGDTFIGVPLMLALLIMLKGLKLKSQRRTVIYAIAAAFILSTGVLIWNGSPYIIVIYMLSLALLALYSFISWKPELARSVLLFTGALFSVYILQSIYLALHAARTGLALDGTSFLAFYAALIAVSALSYWLIRRGRVGILSSASGRAAVFVGAALVLLLIVAVAFGSDIRAIATAAGVTAPPTASVNTTNETSISYAVGSTTQELQKPSFSFLFASFGLGLYLAPIGVILFILFGGILEQKNGQERNPAIVALIALLSYLLVTAYLQYNAIRYNSLVSIPIAIFAAYALYSVLRIYSGNEDWAKRFASLSFVLGIAACMFYLAFLLFSSWHSSGSLRLLLEGIGSVLVALFLVIDTATRGLRRQAVGRFSFMLSVCLLSGYLIVRAYRIASLGSSVHSTLMLVEGALIAVVAAWAVLDTAIRVSRKEIRLRTVGLAILGGVIIFSIAFTILESYASTQADGINPSFLAAMAWMKNNTASNATVLALWPDGSVVEGWANRTSYMDSVGGENGIRIFYFARYLVNDTPDSQYLYGIGKPQYLVARQYWLTELTGLVAEGIPQNPNNYTYTVMQSIGQPYQTANEQIYSFGNGAYNVTLVNRISNQTRENYSAYLGAVGQASQYRISRVTLYNTTSTRYAEFNAAPGSYQLNYTLMIFYTGSVIQGAIIATDGLYGSNLFRLVWLCNQYECPYSNSTARISPVYINNDTRIYKINYT